MYAESMVSMIGLGVAVDYSLFVLARFREELAAGASREDAVVQAMRTSGRAVVFSGLTVLVSLGTVWIVPVRAVQSMAAASMLVVAVAVLRAATLLPALLHLLGPNVDRWRVPFVGTGDPSGGVFWHRMTGAVDAPAGHIVRQRRGRAAADGLADHRPAHGQHLALAAAPRRGGGTGLERAPARRDGARAGTRRRVRGRRDAAARAVRGLHPARGRGAGAAGWRAIRTSSAARSRCSPWAPASRSSRRSGSTPRGCRAVNQLVPRVRRVVADSALQRVATTAVGGDSAFQRDLNDEVGNDMPYVIAALLLLAYLVLVLMLRSLVLPLKAVLTNLLSISAAYGVLVAVFEWGWFDWTGFHHIGTIGTLTPPLVLAITFGLSMDYEVFLLSRIRERYDEHGDTARAVAEGVASSARLISSAALIMVAVFSAFVLTGVPAIKEIGLGLAVAIAVDATITRLVLVPATMVLLGDANWYLPGWLRSGGAGAARVLPRLDRVGATLVLDPFAR